MATLTIRDLDEELRASLRIRAARHGRSMEAEVREILRDALARPAPPDQLGSRRPDTAGPISRLYFVGHWTRPGGGVTPVLVSAQRVAAAILRGRES